MQYGLPQQVSAPFTVECPLCTKYALRVYLALDGLAHAWCTDCDELGDADSFAERHRPRKSTYSDDFHASVQLLKAMRKWRTRQMLERLGLERGVNRADSHLLFGVIETRHQPQVTHRLQPKFLVGNYAKTRPNVYPPAAIFPIEAAPGYISTYWAFNGEDEYACRVSTAAILGRRGDRNYGGMWGLSRAMQLRPGDPVIAAASPAAAARWVFASMDAEIDPVRIVGLAPRLGWGRRQEPLTLPQPTLPTWKLLPGPAVLWLETLHPAYAVAAVLADAKVSLGGTRDRTPRTPHAMYDSVLASATTWDVAVRKCLDAMTEDEVVQWLRGFALYSVPLSLLGDVLGRRHTAALKLFSFEDPSERIYHVSGNCFIQETRLGWRQHRCQSSQARITHFGRHAVRLHSRRPGEDTALWRVEGQKGVKIVEGSWHKFMHDTVEWYIETVSAAGWVPTIPVMHPAARARRVIRDVVLTFSDTAVINAYSNQTLGPPIRPHRPEDRRVQRSVSLA